MENLLQRDITISKIPFNVGYKYRLIVKGDPCDDKYLNGSFDFGIVSINPETGAFNWEMHHLSDSIQESDLQDPNTFCITVSQN